MADVRITVVAVIDVPAEAVAVFRRYEDLVLPLLTRYAGTLERRCGAATARRRSTS